MDTMATLKAFKRLAVNRTYRFSVGLSDQTAARLMWLASQVGTTKASLATSFLEEAVAEAFDAMSRQVAEGRAKGLVRVDPYSYSDPTENPEGVASEAELVERIIEDCEDEAWSLFTGDARDQGEGGAV